MHDHLKTEYESILRAYLSGAGEAAVLQAYDFTRRCLREGLAPDDVVAFHMDVMADSPQAASAQSLLLEIVMAFSLSYRQTLEELERAHAELERVSRFKSRMLSMVAHDLTNHVTAIRLLAMFLSRESAGIAQERVQQILEVVEDQQTLLSNLLDLGQLERGKLHLELSPVEVKALIERCVAKARKTATSHQFTVSGEETMVMGDRAKLQQIIDNLISNAVKYSPQGGPVDIVLSAQDGRATVAVRDHGVGIGTDDLKNIFEPFYRAEGGSRAATGTGLGLSIVRSLLGLQHGTIDVSSVPGEGSTFRFTLPQAGQQAASSERAVKALPAT